MNAKNGLNSMEMAVFWLVSPCSLVDVTFIDISEVLAAEAARWTSGADSFVSKQ